MSSEEWLEVEVTVTDQANRTATKHIEFQAADADPGKAAQEFVDHARKNAGTARVHDANSEA